MTRRLAVALVLLTGCTSVYDTNVPIGCEEDDADGDGWLAEACLPVGSDVADCDDADPDVHPGAAELCNDVDDDCDLRFDEGLEVATFYPDCDGDALGGDAAVLMACDEALRDAPPCEDGDGTWVEASGDCDDADPTRQLSCDACGSIDLLFVVDDTDSMGPAQARMAEALPAVLAALATGDLDADGTEDTEPVADLHFGVVTTDLGSRGYDVPSCSPADLGEDAVLSTASAACGGPFPSFLAYDPASTELDGLSADAACLVQVGIDGCVFEQPLEAALQALTPAASHLRFHPGDRLGHGDLFNDGFLRDDSVLVITALTDEDDCSVEDDTLFDPAGTSEEPTNVRCALSPDALRGVERYTSGLLALRPAEDLVYAVVAGVPEDRAAGLATLDDYRALAGDARMVPVPGRDDGTELLASCTSADGAILAVPPVRLTELGRTLTERGARTVLGSICAPTYEAAGRAIVDAAVASRDARCAD